MLRLFCKTFKAGKSQFALEFLITYGWAILTLAVTLAALFYFGVFEFSKFLPQECNFPSQFECLDFTFDGPNTEIRFKLINNVAETIDVTSFEVTNDAAAPLTCTTNPALAGWQAGVDHIFTFTGCTGGTFISGERTDAIITMKYCSPATLGCPEHTVKGKITAVVN